MRYFETAVVGSANIYLVLSISAICSKTVVADEASGTTWACLVGVEEYDHLAPLRYAANDIDSLLARLPKLGGSAKRTFVFKNEKYRTRLFQTAGIAGPPTKQEVIGAVHKLVANADSNDLILFAFSGHGVTIAGTSYLCPLGGSINDQASLIALKDVVKILSVAKAKKRLILIDACRKNNLPIEFYSKSRETTEDLRMSTISGLLTPGTVILSSCSDGEASHEARDLAHSIFFHSLFDVLDAPRAADTNGNNKLEVAELLRQARKGTAGYASQRHQVEQRPTLIATHNPTWSLLDLGQAKKPNLGVPDSVRDLKLSPKTTLETLRPNSLYCLAEVSELIEDYDATYRDDCVAAMTTMALLHSNPRRELTNLFRDPGSEQRYHQIASQLGGPIRFFQELLDLADTATRDQWQRCVDMGLASDPAFAPDTAIAKYWFDQAEQAGSILASFVVGKQGLITMQNEQASLEALKMAANGTQNQPGITTAWVALGEHQRTQGHPTKAVEYYLKARETGNGQGTLGIAALISKKYDDAANNNKQMDPEERHIKTISQLYGEAVKTRHADAMSHLAQLWLDKGARIAPIQFEAIRRLAGDEDADEWSWRNLREAAELDDPDALFLLAMRKYSHDTSIFNSLLRRAAEFGSQDAILLICEYHKDNALPFYLGK